MFMRMVTSFIPALGTGTRSDVARLKAEDFDRGGPIDGWTVESAGDGLTLLVRARETGSAETGMFVVAGRQTVTAEGLEVLTFPTRGPAVDGDALDDVLARAADRGEIAVLPWGFGKWRGRRRRALEGALRERPPASIFLGDCSTRPGERARTALAGGPHRSEPGQDAHRRPVDRPALGRGVATRVGRPPRRNPRPLPTTSRFLSTSKWGGPSGPRVHPGAAAFRSR